MSSAYISYFEVDDINKFSFLFQSEFLIIAESRILPGGMEYRLEYPNIELRQRISKELLRYSLSQKNQILSDHAKGIIDGLMG